MVSVAAGVSLAQLAEWMTADSAVRPALFRVIPTRRSPCGEHDLRRCTGADEACTERVLGIFRELGEAMLVDEPDVGDRNDPRLVRNRLRSALCAGVGRRRSGTGLPGRGRRRISSPATLRGAAELLLQRGEHPEAEIDRVTTPGGITVRGLNEMEQAGFSAAVIRGLKACK